jgi:hypothetical protein
MRKEHLILETQSREQRDSMIARFKECIEFSGSCMSDFMLFNMHV